MKLAGGSLARKRLAPGVYLFAPDDQIKRLSRFYGNNIAHAPATAERESAPTKNRKWARFFARAMQNLSRSNGGALTRSHAHKTTRRNNNNYYYCT